MERHIGNCIDIEIYAFGQNEAIAEYLYASNSAGSYMLSAKIRLFPLAYKMLWFQKLYEI